MAFETFDDNFNASTGEMIDQKPIWAMDLNDEGNEKKAHEWLMKERDFLKEKNRDRFQEIVEYVKEYTAYNRFIDETVRRDREEKPTISMSRMPIPETMDLVENAVAKLVKYKPGYTILPSNDEFNDKNAAEATKAWVDHIRYTQNFEGTLDPKMKRLSKIMGEAYLFIEWNPDLGDPVEGMDRLRDQLEAGEKVQLMNENGDPELDDNGQPIWIEQEIMTGEVEYKIRPTTDILIEWAQEYDAAKYMFWREVKTVEEARIDYPGKESLIKGGAENIVYDFEDLEPRFTNKNEVVIWHFYHKRHKVMPLGRHIVFTDEGILKNTRAPYSHKSFPCVRLVDKEIPGKLHGVSTIRFTKPITRAFEKLTNMILRNQYLVSHPKWVYPVGSIKREALANDITLVEFKGPQAPQLIQQNPTPSEVFNFRDILKQEAQQKFGIHGVSRGEPPAGIDAGIALQFLSEQENERQNVDMLKAAEFNRMSIILTISVAGDYYEPEEKRQVKVLGKNGAWKTMFFESANLNKAYDVRVQNASALPETRSARQQYLITMKDKFPNLVSDEQFMDLMGLAQDQKFQNMVTASVGSADAENEALMDPNSEVEPPSEYEDHIQHWKQHVILVRSWWYKNKTPEAIRQKVEDHIFGHEYLMTEKAVTNPAFAAALATLTDFPLFYKVAPAPVAPPMPPEAPQGQPGPMPPMMEEQALITNPLTSQEANQLSVPAALP